MRTCSRCKSDKAEKDFYKHSGRPGLMHWCKRCINSATAERQVRNKTLAIALMGGKCSHCGYSKYVGALDFHHLDRTIKVKSLAELASCGWERYWEEVCKCVLLCANCHREEEDRLSRLLRSTDEDAVLLKPSWVFDSLRGYHL